MARRFDVIYDVGTRDGKDAAFYLHKNYHVVAIEANPNSFAKLQAKFASEIESGKLTLLNVAIAEKCGEVDFFVNLTMDGWSSLYPDHHPGTTIEKIKVQGVTFDKLIEEYGVPYYLKVDIEGGDGILLRHMQGITAKPQFLSVEESSIDYFPLLWSLGYRGFKILNQENVPNIKYDGWKFEQGSSGPFGDDVPGSWMPFGDAILDYMLNVRDCRGKKLRFRGWSDIHATLDEPTVNDRPYPRRRGPDLRRMVGKGYRRLQQMVGRVKPLSGLPLVRNVHAY